MISYLKSKIAALLREEEAATAVEYAVILMLIIGVCITTIQVIGSESAGFWQVNEDDIDSAFKNAKNLSNR